MSSTIQRKFVKAYLGLNRRIWVRLPGLLRRGYSGRAYGRHLHTLVCRHSERNQNHSTFFLRNRPELELMCRVLKGKSFGSSLQLCVLACSKGAEVYSILWAIRSGRPDLKITTHAVDISPEILRFAQRGIYSLKPLERDNDGGNGKVNDATWRDQDVSIFERLTETEVESMFELVEDEARIKSWLKEGITWMRGDANEAKLARDPGPQDIVVANRFLCHMDRESAEKCLRNIGRLVRPGGFLFVSGVDLDVRTKVAKSLGWKPLPDLLREVHEGDRSLHNGWPLEWWGLEPFCHDLRDWKIRYASVFQIGEQSGC
jgi:chemotaxis methyl-accepting protein methylase